MAFLACTRLTAAMRQQQQESDGVNGLSGNISVNMKLQDWAALSLAKNRQRAGGNFGAGRGANKHSLILLCGDEGVPVRDQASRFASNASSICLTSSDSDEEACSSTSSSSSFVFSSNFSDATTASPPSEPEDHVNGPLDSLGSLRAALPLKRRGLSQYFSGKSQSFSSLADVGSVDDLAKPENPFVKRRRTGYLATSAPPGVQVSGRATSFPPLPSTSSIKSPPKRTHSKQSQGHVADPLSTMSSKSFSAPNLSFCVISSP